MGMKTKMPASDSSINTDNRVNFDNSMQQILPRRQQQQQIDALSTSSCAILRSNCLQAPVQQVSSSTTTWSIWRISTRLWATNSLKCKLNSQLQHRNRLNQYTKYSVSYSNNLMLLAPLAQAAPHATLPSTTCQ
jgi:hypothetical protein